MGRHELWAVAPVGFATQATAARLYSRLRSLLRVLTRHTAVSCARRWCVTAYASFRRRTAPVLLSSFQSMTSRASRNSVTQARLRQERRARARTEPLGHGAGPHISHALRSRTECYCAPPRLCLCTLAWHEALVTALTSASMAPRAPPKTSRRTPALQPRAGSCAPSWWTWSEWCTRVRRRRSWPKHTSAEVCVYDACNVASGSSVPRSRRPRRRRRRPRRA